MLKRTALFIEHQRLGGRIINFGGWEMPVQYTGVIDEHVTCRTSAGLFDVSHMGEFHVDGNDAERFLNYLVTNNVSRLAEGQALYTAMCNVSGGIVDDLIIYRRARTRFLICVNASNTQKDFEHVMTVQREFKTPKTDLEITNESAKYTQIAIQGPRAAEIVHTVCDEPLAGIKNYWFIETNVLKRIPTILARTGYTGEDGFELYVPWESGPEVWRALMESGKPLGLKPCGLGARDTLRLEMKYPLYGQELTETTNPLEAGLGWVTKLDQESKGDFVGRTSILRAQEKGLKRRLVGLKILDRGIPRQGYKIFDSEGGRAGEVTSGTQSPSLGVPIAIAYVRTDLATIGTRLSIEVRGSRLTAEVVPTPFVKK